MQLLHSFRLEEMETTLVSFSLSGKDHIRYLLGRLKHDYAQVKLEPEGSIWVTLHGGVWLGGP